MDQHLRRLGTLRAALAVGAGGLVGTSLRYLLGLASATPAGTWPAVTLGINLLGAFALGLLLEALVRLGPDAGGRRLVRLAVGTGLLGSFTTYSTLALDVLHLLDAGRFAPAALYAGVSVVGGVLAAGFGIAVGTRVERFRAGPP